MTTMTASRLRLVLVVLLASGAVGVAQGDRPLSPAGRSATQIGGDPFDPVRGYVGGHWLEISYGRPITRGRDIFGPDDFVEFLNDGAPVWRAGANVTTRLHSGVAIEIGDTVVPAGEHTMFIELGRSEWTLIVSGLRAQTDGFDEDDPETVFGAYGYTPDRDLVRVPMTVEALPYSHDQLHWQFLDVTPEGGRMAMFWANRMASVPFRVAD